MDAPVFQLPRVVNDRHSRYSDSYDTGSGWIFDMGDDMSAKLRTPTKTDKENSERWLAEAHSMLHRNEYHRVKLLCRQVIRALRRKEKEEKNTK